MSAEMQESSLWAIHRTPDAATVTPGAQVRYSCDWLGSTPRPPGTDGELDGVRWHLYKADAPDGSRIHNGPAGKTWDCVWPNEPGDYLIFAAIRSTVGPQRGPVYCSLSQRVGATAPFLREGLEQILAKGQAPTAWEAELSIQAFRKQLDAIAKRFPPGPGEVDAHAATVEQWRKHAQALRALLQPTDGRRRIPFIAFHLEVATQKTRALFLFLTELEPALRAHRQMGMSEKRWVLVDWSDPLDRRFCGSYVGEGATRESAIRAAFRAWDWENRYPPGHVLYDLPPELASTLGGDRRREMKTNGKNLTDEVIDALAWIAVGGMLVSGIAFLFVPVAAVSSAAVAASLLASTGGAVLSIAQRRREGIFDWEADAIDGLTILGNLVGAGTWARGARVLAFGKGGKIVDYVFIGTRVGIDGLQGMLVAHARAEELLLLAEDPEIPPEDRARRTLGLLADLATLGLMTVVSIRAGKREAEVLGKKPKQLAGRDLPLPGPPGPPQKPDTTKPNQPGATSESAPKDARLHSVDEKLNALTAQDGRVDLTGNPVSEGTAGKGRQETRTTTPLHHLDSVKPEETVFAREYSADKHKWKRRIISEERLLLEDEHGFIFKANCNKATGALDVTIQTKDVKKVPPRSPALWAKELFPRMYEHFEQVGNPVKRLDGTWAWDNYDSAKLKFDEEIGKGTPREEAEKIAVKHATTYLAYHEGRGFTKVVHAHINEEFRVFEFEIEKP
jgi:hypothetical protein